MLTLSGIRAVRHTADPGMTLQDRMRNLEHLDEVNAMGPWTDAGDDHINGEYTEASEQVNGCNIYTSTLTFQLSPGKSDKDLPLGGAPQCWSFQDRAGKWYLIGIGNRPGPVSVCNFDNSGSGNAPTAKVTVTWKSTVGCLRIK